MDASPQRVGQRLRQAREHAKLDLPLVASAAELPERVVAEAEAGHPVASHQMARLAEVLGLSELDLVADGPLVPTSVGVLLRGVERPQSLASHLGHLAAVVRDAHDIESLLGMTRQGFVSGVTPAASPQTAPHEQGEWLADSLRKKLDLGSAPIRSMAILVSEIGVRLVWTDALETAIQGLALYDPHWGASVVVSLRNREHHWWALRSTIAHELCHVLYDRVPSEPLGVVSRAGVRDPVEQRANAFSIYFLAPRDGVARFLRDRGCRPTEVDRYDVHALMEHFGLGKEAATWHLKHLGWLDEAGRKALVDESYEIATATDLESPRSRGPLDRWLDRGVPLERIEIVETALAAYHREKITLGRLHEVLGLDPFEDVTALVA